MESSRSDLETRFLWVSDRLDRSLNSKISTLTWVLKISIDRIASL